MTDNRRPFTRSNPRVRRERYDEDSRPNPYLLDAETARNRPASDGLTWKKIDLHLHTPASSDYRDPGISYLDILKKAEEKSLDMIAFADHNTVSGYAAMHQEIETLTLLERLGRISDEERATLNEYRRLLKKIVVLPGFEFTATFGFHILGIFPEGTSVRKLEYLLLNLNVPEERMLRGAPDVGSTSDVLSSYAAITQGGGMAIAAHANSSNGVAMQGFPFGGQTKIAYTQDANLVCLEVTDLEQTGRRTTASFYNGTKTEYPRRMHCIQGSDAHSLDTEQSDSNNKRLGVGARVTEVLMREASFSALREVLMGEDYTRTRPYRANRPWELIEAARAKGPNQISAFHDRLMHPTLRTRHIMQDVVAFANGYGGLIYIGAGSDVRVPMQGVDRPDDAIRMLREDVHKMVEPPLDVNFDIKPGAGERGIIVMNVPGGDNRPYIFAPSSQIYIRDAGVSMLAGRAEMIKLIVDAAKARGTLPSTYTEAPVSPLSPAVPAPTVPAVGRVEVAAASVGEPIASPEQATTQTSAPSVARGRRSWREEREQRQAQARQDAAASTPQPAEAAQEPATPELALPPERRATLTGEPQRDTGVAPERPAAQTAPTPSTVPATPATRRPALHDLPPEKIKGQVQPMAPRNAPPPAVPTTPEPHTQPQPTSVDATDVATALAPTEVQQLAEPEVTPVEAEGVAVGAIATAEVEPAVLPRASGRARRRPGSAIPAPQAAAPAPEVTVDFAPEEPVAAQAPEVEAAKPSRSRSRRKSATQAAEETPTESSIEATAASSDTQLEVAVPMEATLSAEHLSREEIVEAEAEKPKRGRGRGRGGRGAAQEKELEIEAPTAAAAATEAGAEAILVEAELEPGPQIPGELPPEAMEEVSAPRRGRPRRKSEAVKAAEAAAHLVDATQEAVEAPPVEAATSAEPQAETQSRRRRGGRRAAEPAGAPVATTEAPADNLPDVALSGQEPPEPPNTGVEIIDSLSGQKATSHTMRDLRNGQTVRNVTKKSARRLLHYAIVQHERCNPALSEVLWHTNIDLPIGLWRRDERAGAVRYDLVSRYPDGSLRIFYGVTDDGVTGPWRELVEQAVAAGYTGPDAPEQP